MCRRHQSIIGALAACCCLASIVSMAHALPVHSRALQQAVAAPGGSCGPALNTRCPSGQCCSKFGFCGTTSDHCGVGCHQGFGACGSNSAPQQPTTTVPVAAGPQHDDNRAGSSSGVGSLLSKAQFEEIFGGRNAAQCTGRGFYTYQAFLTAAAAFPAFGSSSTPTVNKRELAAFLAHITQETSGLCWKTEGKTTPPSNPYCQPSAQYPCAPGKKYYGRGPMQLSWNYNYNTAGRALGFDGLNNPEAVENDAVLAFKTAIWFWMTPQGAKPSAHDVITGRWSPSTADVRAGRTAGFGMTTNIINGGKECGQGDVPQEQNRVRYFTRYAGVLGVSVGSGASCANQQAFG